MDPDEMLYRGKVQRMMLVARSLCEVELDADEIRDTVERAHSLGASVDPTAYRDRLQDGSLDLTEKVATIMIRAQRELREVLGPHLDAAAG